MRNEQRDLGDRAAELLTGNTSRDAAPSRPLAKNGERQVVVFVSYVHHNRNISQI